jgi:ribA/ribD-fused uncharacterized protein
MQWEWNGQRVEECVVFFKVKEEWGGLSNMSNDYPLMIGGVRVGSSEALYQAMRFPHEPAWQQEILTAPHAMAAKMKAKKGGRRKNHTRPDWETVQEEVMRWCLRIKWAQHPHRFGGLLRATRSQPIAERSSKDRFWGAVLESDQVLRGENRLGRLLMELRQEQAPRWASGPEGRRLQVEPPAIREVLLLGRPVAVVEGVAR